jgi:vacuolar-type H+-ATPase subunit I/STV1
MTIPDADAIKYGFMTLVTIIIAGFKWMMGRQVKRIDDLETKVNDLQTTTAPREAINKELDEIRASITESRQEFRDEHSRTRAEIKADNKETRDLLLELIRAKQ